jgi:hypothetical protein
VSQPFPTRGRFLVAAASYRMLALNTYDRSSTYRMFANDFCRIMLQVTFVGVSHCLFCPQFFLALRPKGLKSLVVGDVCFSLYGCFFYFNSNTL